jgi:hypothetical protein
VLTSDKEADIIILAAVKCDLLAQLGEHHLDRVGVSGSSPLQVILYGSPRIKDSRAFLRF